METNGESIPLKYQAEQVDCKRITFQIEFPDPSEVNPDDSLIIEIHEPHAFLSEDGTSILDPKSIDDKAKNRKKLVRQKLRGNYEWQIQIG